MPAPLGKLVITLLAIVAFVTFATVVAEPSPWRLIPEPSEEAAEVELVIVLPDNVKSAMVPLKFVMSTPWYCAFVRVLPVIDTVPITFCSVPTDWSLKAMFESNEPAIAAVPELLIVLFVNENPFTSVPFTPLRAVFWMFILSNDGLNVDVSEMPWLVV